jgi:hypothetical protein
MTCKQWIAQIKSEGWNTAQTHLVCNESQIERILNDGIRQGLERAAGVAMETPFETSVTRVAAAILAERDKYIDSRKA